MADPLATFSSLKTELLSLLRERYPEGLTISEDEPKVPIPESIHEMSLGVPIDTFEPDKGWVELNTSMGDIIESPKSLGLKDNAIVAFAFIEGEGDEQKLEFVVHFSSYEDEYGDGDEGMGEEDED